LKVADPPIITIVGKAFWDIKSCAERSIEPTKVHVGLRCLGNSSGNEPYSPMIRVYDEAGNVIKTHEHKGDFKEP